MKFLLAVNGIIKMKRGKLAENHKRLRSVKIGRKLFEL